MNEWQRMPIGALIDGLEAGVSVRGRDGDHTRPAVLKTSAVADGKVDVSEVKAIIAADRSRAKCELVRDSLIISRMNTPALVGAVGYVDDAASEVYLPDRLWLARPRVRSGTDVRWLAYALGFGDAAASVRGLATGTSNSMKNIPKSRLLALEIDVPAPSEQSAIAETLRAVDDLISSLAQLLAKKRAIKQGMMQELLSGRTRLPSFTNEWDRSSSLGSVAQMSSGGTPPSSIGHYYGGGVPWVSISDMTRGGKYLETTAVTLSAAGLAASAAKLYEPDVVLYAMYASLGECSIAVGSVSSSQAILGIVPGPRLDREFLYYYLQSIKPKVKLLGQQGTQSNLNAGMVRSFQLDLPQVDEQRAIAGVLSDADADIEALEHRLESARAIKQGMMQELLTGRTRLVAEEVAA